MEIDDFRRSEGRMRDLVDDCDYIETRKSIIIKKLRKCLIILGLI